MSSSRPRRAHDPKHRAAPYDDAPPPNLKSMTNSERGKYYRRRRQLYGAHLDQCVADLREEIAALTFSRQVQQELALSQRRTPLGAAAQIASEYCSLFSHGAPVRLAVDEQDASASLVSQATNAQRGFLSAVMNDNVRFGEFLGVELLLDQWERYSLFHAAIDWTMTSLRVVQLAEPRVVTPDNRGDDGPLVVSITADLRVRFSRRTIEEVFPHLVGDEALTQSLIGLEVTYSCVNHFHFNERGKIEWYAPEVDFVGALMKALKSPELVVRVMGSALIAKDHMIGDENDGRELAVVDLNCRTASNGVGHDEGPVFATDCCPPVSGCGILSDAEPESSPIYLSYSTSELEKKHCRAFDVGGLDLISLPSSPPNPRPWCVFEQVSRRTLALHLQDSCEGMDGKVSTEDLNYTSESCCCSIYMWSLQAPTPWW